MRVRPTFRLAVQACLLLSCAAMPVFAQEPPEAASSIEATDARDADASKIPLAEIRRYVGVYNAVKEAYVEPIDDQKLMQAAIRGLLFDLDPHSVYMDRSAAEDFDESSRGAYDGI